MSAVAAGRRGAPAARVASGLVCSVLALCLLAGCTSVRSNLGTTDSSCYLGLPSATRAEGSSGRLTGVHRYSLKTLRQKAPQLLAALPSGYRSSQQVCVFAFSGSFTRSSVTKPLGAATGPVAIVVATSPSNQLIGTVIVPHVPLHFGHPHLG
ncbi:MAG TPA: hypothetical protein VMQ59_03255 [Acidimicrobiales bacterium]|nr:hypothetical protein [Acidimicrobiales bacterium]